MTPAPRFCHHLARFHYVAAKLGRDSSCLADDSGNSLIEIAFIFSFLGLPLLLGTAVTATVVYSSIEISSAAHAGAAYGMQSDTFASNTSGIVSAAQSEAGDLTTSLSVVPTTYYACATAMTGTKYTGTNAQTNASSACAAASDHAVEFVQVNTSATIAPRIHMPGLASTFTVTGFAVMEVEQ